MHTYLINLKKVIDPLDLDEIQNYKVDIDCFMEDEIRHSCIDYVGDEYEQIDIIFLRLNLAHLGELLIIS